MVDSNKPAAEDACVVPQAIPVEMLAAYRVDSDPHSEQDIASYVHGQARGETVLHVERVKSEIILSAEYEIWDVTTDKDRWWVITNLTNLYSQRFFPSLDYTLSLHIGLMARIRDRQRGVDSDQPGPFDEVIRRIDQAEERHDAAVEAEDYQTVGMLLREALVALASGLRRRVELTQVEERPRDADFVSWANVLMDHLCGGGSNKALRQFLKHSAKETWQLVNWLTHAKGADEVASAITLHSCKMLAGSFFQIHDRKRLDAVGECPICKSRNIRSHFDIFIAPDGAYFLSCGVCDWTNHPATS